MPEHKLTDRQKLADFSANYGLPKIYLRAYEELLDYTVKDGIARVLVSRYTVDETARQLRFKRRSQVLRTWSKNSHGAWIENPPFAMADESFKPITKSKFDGLTVEEWREKMLWAMDCARPGFDWGSGPGTGRTPLHSFDRTIETPDEPEPMKRHWSEWQKVDY
jgi:hypothetical protein